MALRPLEYEIRARDRTARAFRSVEQRTSRLDRAFVGLARLGARAFAGGAVAGTLALAAGISKATSAMEEFDLISKRARQFGLDSDFYQTIGFQAGEASISQDRLNSSLAIFTKNVGLAAIGQGELASTLSRLNPQLLETLKTTTSQEERWKLIADAVTAAGSATDKTAIAYAAFGRSGGELVRVLEKGRDGFADAAQRAAQLGVIIDRDLLKQSEQLQNDFGNVSRVIDLQLKQAFIDLGPVIVDTLELFSDVLRGLRGLKLAVIDFLDTTSVAAKADQTVSEMQKVEDSIRRIEDSIAHIRPSVEAGFLPETAIAGDLQQLQRLQNQLDQLRQAEIELERFGRRQKQLENPISSGVVFGSGDGAGDPFKTPVTSLGKLKSGVDAVSTSLDEANNRADFFSQGAFDAISGLIDGTATLEDTFLSLADAIAKAALEAALLGTGPLSGGSGGSGFLGNLFSSLFSSGPGVATGAPLNLAAAASGVPAFAAGGSGRIAPGSGGPDSRLFLARVSPGEPFAFGDGARSGGGRTIVNIHNQNGAPVEQRSSQVGNDEVLDVFIGEMDSRLSDGRSGRGFQRRIGASVQPVRR